MLIIIKKIYLILVLKYLLINETFTNLLNYYSVRLTVSVRVVGSIPLDKGYRVRLFI